MSVVAAAVIGSVAFGALTAPDAPDNSGVNKAAVDNAALGKEQLDWSKQVYAEGAPARAAAEERAKAVSDAQLKGMDFATRQAEELDSYNRSTFRPLEQQLVSDAQGFNTMARRAEASQAAVADVDRAFSATQDANARALARSGIAPGSAKSQSLMQDAALGATTARAGAATMAGRNIEQQSWSRMSDVANLGRGLASSQATQQQIASNAGAQSAAAGMSALAAQQSGAGGVQAGFNGAVAANNSAGNLFSQASNLGLQADAATSAAMSGLGSSMGQYAGSKAGSAALTGLFASSDENIKSNRRPAGAARMLKRVLDTDVETWEYDPAKGGPDDGGQEHTGPMAQHVRQTMGERAAPGGKVIDMISVQGNLIGGVQALAAKVKKLEKRAA